MLFGCATEVAEPQPEPVAAQQQPICGDRNRILAELAARYGEHLQNWGMTPRGVVVELLVSDTGSWTLLYSDTNGISCMIAGGDHWGESTSPNAKRTTL